MKRKEGSFRGRSLIFIISWRTAPRRPELGELCKQSNLDANQSKTPTVLRSGRLSRIQLSVRDPGTQNPKRDMPRKCNILLLRSMNLSLYKVLNSPLRYVSKVHNDPEILWRVSASVTLARSPQPPKCAPRYEEGNSGSKTMPKTQAPLHNGP